MRPRLPVEVTERLPDSFRVQVPVCAGDTFQELLGPAVGAGRPDRPRAAAVVTAAPEDETVVVNVHLVPDVQRAAELAGPDHLRDRLPQVFVPGDLLHPQRDLVATDHAEGHLVRGAVGHHPRRHPAADAGGKLDAECSGSRQAVEEEGGGPTAREPRAVDAGARCVVRPTLVPQPQDILRGGGAHRGDCAADPLHFQEHVRTVLRNLPDDEHRHVDIASSRR
mmetsp:Transcript_82567/g.234183  ORF Transcript_82567/g.234183 Transcript_82567/m.234183 type:complete len:223 (+) Transcript_82567:1108-1776(+)